MIISVYYAKDSDEAWAFSGDYDELQETGSDRPVLVSSEIRDCPVVILHGPAKEPLRKAVCARDADYDAIASELDNLYRHIKTQLKNCDISDVEHAEIRLFVHFGSQSPVELQEVNRRLVSCRKPAKFQCFSVSRYHGIPRDLYRERDDMITPPRTKESIEHMCEALGCGGGHGGCDFIRALIVLCQAAAALPEAERGKVLKGGDAEKWWTESFSSPDTSAYEDAIIACDPNLMKLTEKIKAALSHAPRKTDAPGAPEKDKCQFDISNFNIALAAEIAAQKLQEN